jgi:DNA-binding NarL/FixJ family response regulator
MDIGMPEVNGIECTRVLKQVNPGIRIVMVTGSHDSESVQKSLDVGADGYLTKPIVITQFLVTLGFAVGNRPDPHIVLTARENEIMRLLAEGLLYKEIAERLGVSFSSVHKHQHQIFMKLHTSNRTEAIEKWRKLGGR